MAEPKSAKSPAAVHRGVDALAELLRETRGRGGRRELVLSDQLPNLADDELLVLIAGKRNLVARSVHVPQGVDLRNLELGAAGAALAVEEIGPRSPEASADLSAHEQAVLNEGGFEDRAESEMSPADEGALEYLKLLQEALPPERVARMLGVNASRVRQRLGERSLYGIKDGRAWKLPRFQFRGRRLVPGIEKVLPTLPATMHPVAVQRWFRSPHVDLEADDGSALTPLEWLTRGHAPAHVADVAALL